jgi:sugar lactone lactonase YvrE
LWVSDNFDNIVRRIAPGAVVTTAAGSLSYAGSLDATGLAALFNNPAAVGADSLGNLYIADSNNNTIRMVTQAGVVTTVAGSPGMSGSADGTGAAARFTGPTGLAVDVQGNVFVTDSGNGTIRKIAPGGVVTTVAGTPGVTGSADGVGPAASFNLPYGIAVAANGTLYVADTYKRYHSTDCARRRRHDLSGHRIRCRVCRWDRRCSAIQLSD